MGRAPCPELGRGHFLWGTVFSQIFYMAEPAAQIGGRPKSVMRASFISANTKGIRYLQMLVGEGKKLAKPL
jgi:hypothetical protein